MFLDRLLAQYAACPNQSEPRNPRPPSGTDRQTGVLGGGSGSAATALRWRLTERGIPRDLLRRCNDLQLRFMRLRKFVHQCPRPRSTSSSPPSDRRTATTAVRTVALCYRHVRWASIGHRWFLVRWQAPAHRRRYAVGLPPAGRPRSRSSRDGGFERTRGQQPGHRQTGSA